MEDHGQNPRKRHNVFGVFVDKSLGHQSSVAEDHDPKKLKHNSEAPLSSIDQQAPVLALPNMLVSAFEENTTDGIKFQLFVSKSYSASTSTSPPPVYTLKVTSASNNNTEVEPAGNIADGGVAPVLTETRIVAEGQFMLRSRL
ncbi:uncharacterized protein LOC106771577 [Vigna radiata var. radiata]|uniref:Uncharacterized protein LOC106771577 n=2 Tax=Vigna TaxID=3913 RepID=A0A1S3V436_VIGRR|nr:uncharacterized protein LOC106771577 [Vigna radiata var. radiata]